MKFVTVQYTGLFVLSFCLAQQAGAQTQTQADVPPIAQAPAAPADDASADTQQAPNAAPAAVSAADRKVDIFNYRVEGNTTLPRIDVEKAVMPFLGPQRPASDVEAARAALEKAYRDRGFETVGVEIPAQDVRNGIVRLNVTELKVGRLRVTDARYYSPEDIKDNIPALAEGQVPNYKQVSKEMAALNRKGGRVITPSLRAGDTPGTVDVELQVDDTLPFHGSFELNDRSSSRTDRLRASASIRYTNLFQRGHSLSLQGQITPTNPSQSWAVSGSYVAPIADSGFSALGYFVHSRSDVAAIGGIGVIGSGDIFGLRGLYSFTTGAETAPTVHQLVAGLDYKDFQEQLILGSDTASTPINYVPLTLQYSIGTRTAKNDFNISIGANVGLRGISADEREFRTKRYNASASWAALRLELDYLARLSGGWQAGFRFASQLATGPLISNEQFSAGGLDSVRGYYESQDLGDDGLSGQFQIDTPNLIPNVKGVNNLRFFGFVDAAILRVRDPLKGQQEITGLSSVGLGLNMQLLDRFNASFLLAAPLRAHQRRRLHARAIALVDRILSNFFLTSGQKSMLKRIITLGAVIGALLMPTMASAQDWWNGDWAERRKITLDTKSLQGVTEEVKRAPVLIRLHSGVFDFTKAKPDGSDIRLVGADGKTPLNYHIERYDPSAEIALLWVDVPALTPGANQNIWIYYGSDGAKAVANPGATYDGEQVLVQHLSDDGVPTDATANNNRVAASNAKPTVEGLIGGGATLAADSQIRISPSGSLSVPANGAMTFSAWVKPSEQGMPADAALYSKLGVDGTSALALGLRGGVPYVRLSSGGEAIAGAALAPGGWSHLAVTAGDGVITLYVNGAPVGTVPAALAEMGGEDVIGSVGGLPSFVGDIDEIGRANIARSASAIALLAGSQARSSTMVAVAPQGEAADSAGGHNYFGILFAALTVDAWVVIIILGVMAAISWFVMILKGRLLMQTASANSRFLTSYGDATRGAGAHSGLTASDIGNTAPQSSLARLFEVGQKELKTRFDERRGSSDRYAIAPQSIAAIRSALDAAHAREEQKLNKWMVLLTIAISGGPFLGLLGTVVGVMITFAGVAAAGDVNINAIAPGIAAALLATVAGLAVAIPALFGYNYLQSRLDEISTDNQIFVDELEKRIAETYRPSAQAALATQ